jgi:putative glutamine amidotransferase
MSQEKTVPWIGMPMQMDPGGGKQYLNRQYLDAIAASGGMPLMIPLLETAPSVGPLAERADGILLTGSNSDLDPSLYGAERSSACGPTQPLRDKIDFYLLETAMKCGIPILAICYGVQSLNVFFGGSLIQDIPVSPDASVRHQNPETRGRPSHRIRIAAGSILEPLAGGGSAMVNSTHHQAVDRPGRGLQPIAHAPDGVVESVFCENRNSWILGVQWHPESSFESDDFSRKIFECFLARCRAVRGIDEGTHT